MKHLPSTGVPFVIRLLKAAAELLGRPDVVILLTESFLDFDHPALAFRMHPSSGPLSTRLRVA
jgi:hypothetical protein